MWAFGFLSCFSLEAQLSSQSIYFSLLEGEKKKNYFSFSFKKKYIYFKLKQQMPVPFVPFLAGESRAGLW